MLGKNLIKAAAGNAAAGDYQISRSLRFNSADSAYLSRTPASAGNRKTFTISAWVKRSSGGSQAIMGVGTNTSDDVNFTFNSDKLYFLARVSSSIVILLESTAVYRDFSAWYHVVATIDTTQATASNRVKLYVNGSQITAFGTATYPNQNQDISLNNTVAHEIGRVNNQFGAGQYFNGYMADINFIDGQALTPSSFGETDETTGVWKPIAYAGTYGTNGFHLDFSDNTSTTTLGYDAAGSNDWTLNNFSVTAGAGNDSLVDSPTRYGTDTGAGGEVRGNYCTLNPLDQVGANTYSNGNLDVVVAAGTTNVVSGSIAVSSGKWYWEVLVNSNYASMIGVADANFSASNRSWTTANGWTLYDTGSIYNNSSSTAYGVGFTTNDLISIALDMDNGKVYWAKNGTWLNSGNPVTQTNPGVTGLTGKKITSLLSNGGSGGTNNFIANFGQRPFAYTAPSGFKALCTTNLPDPTVVQGDDYFNTVLYTGNSTVRSITGVGFSPDFTWIKRRDPADDHYLFDSVRTATKYLSSNSTAAETTNANSLTSFDSDGFSLGISNTTNSNTNPFVAWNWKANGAGVSNTDGTISSTVSANTTAGISIVTYTGTGSAATVGHGLGAVPRMIIVKNRDATDAWQVYHAANTANPETDYLVLNTTAGTADAADRWNDTLPTSTVFSIGNGVEVNTNTEDYVAYCFAEVEGFSKFGSYTGNGSADGPFVYTGFRPAWVMIKQSSAAGEHWTILDNQRNTFNVENRELYANLSNAEGANSGNATLDFTSNGFKIRTTNAGQNTNTATYIFACFASNPLKLSLAR